MLKATKMLNMNIVLILLLSFLCLNTTTVVSTMNENDYTEDVNFMIKQFFSYILEDKSPTKEDFHHMFSLHNEAEIYYEYEVCEKMGMSNENCASYIDQCYQNEQSMESEYFKLLKSHLNEVFSYEGEILMDDFYIQIFDAHDDEFFVMGPDIYQPHVNVAFIKEGKLISELTFFMSDTKIPAQGVPSETPYFIGNIQINNESIFSLLFDSLFGIKVN